MDVSEVIYRCDRLLELLEQDREELGKSLKGDLLEEYRNCLDEEMNQVRMIRKRGMSLSE